VEKRGQTGEKGVGWHPRGGWHLSESNKKSDSDSAKKEEQETRRDNAELATIIIIIIIIIERKDLGGVCLKDCKDTLQR